MISAHISYSAPVFNGRTIPEDGHIVGYGAIINKLNLRIPTPEQLSLVCFQNKRYQTKEWQVFPNSYLPDDELTNSEIEALFRHLVFGLKYEGINLLVFSTLIKHYNQQELVSLVNIEPTGQYSRKIWFLLEWISDAEFPEKKALTKKSYVPLVDEKQQYCIAGTKSPRHLVINNLLGNDDFCPIIRKTKKLERLISENYSKQKGEYLKGLRKDILQRASTFLLLKDSKASLLVV